MEVSILVSIAELIDKWTILRIKSEMIEDTDKKRLVSGELEIVEIKVNKVMQGQDGLILKALSEKLRVVNKIIWRAEDRVRDMSRLRRYNGQYMMATRISHRMNEYRFRLKNEINKISKSRIKECKNYV